MKGCKKMKEEKGQILYYRPYPPEYYKKKKSPFSIILRVILIVLIILAVWVVFAKADVSEMQRWIMCKDYVIIRAKPSRNAMECGQLDPGDDIETDDQTENGFIHIVSPTDGWVWAGNVVESQPEKIEAYGYVVARYQVACRRWVNGPQTEKNPWAKNGTMIKVLWLCDEWALTSRGYIQREWLEIEFM